MLRPMTLVSLLAAFAMTTLPSMAQDDLPIYGLNYSPRSGPDWLPDIRCKSSEVIRSELVRLKEYTNRLRFFSNVDCDLGISTVEIAHELGFEMSLSMWVNNDDKVFQGEKKMLNTMIKEHPEWFNDRSVFRDIRVGSEAIYRGELTAEENIKYMEEVKALLVKNNITLPVTISEIGDVYAEHPEMVDAVDFVMANAFTFWEKHPIEGAAAYFKERMTDVINVAKDKGKRFEVGETGWATAGFHKNASEASPENAIKYFTEFTALAEENNWPYYYFTSYDDDWKKYYASESDSDSVETHFGIFEADGTMKAAFADYFQKAIRTEDHATINDDQVTYDHNDEEDASTPADSDVTTEPTGAVDFNG